MRYLTRRFAIGALRRGTGIEQFLAGAVVDGVAAVRWVAISPVAGGYRVSLHTVQDLDGQHADLANFPPLDPVDEQYAGERRELGRTTDEAAALELAEHLTDAVPDSWVNHGVAGDEYLDHHRAGQHHTG